jgi:hypothetical protein
MIRRYGRMLFAILAGNLLYLLISPHLPPAARHRLYRLDWGILVDFWICLAIYGLLEFRIRRKRQPQK